MSALAAGTRLGPYEILSALGAGGMGEVYRATDTRLKRQVAIKVLPAAFTADTDRLARFQREAEVLASINHPNIAHIYGMEEQQTLDGQERVHALVMELVEGEDLSQRIARGALPPQEALPIAKQIAEALEAAHEQHIIHRDLKPANIKIRNDGTVKVLDFGLAKAMEAGQAGAAGRDHLSVSPTITSPAMTHAGIILGTAAYMSPEQAAGKPVDKRTDLWSFGVVLLEMLTGRRAFSHDTVAETMAAVMMNEPDWSKLPATTPATITKLLHRCLEKDRKRRLPDAAVARLDIEDTLAGRADPLIVAPAAVQPSSSRWRIALAVAVAIVAGGAVGTGIVQGLRSAPVEGPVIRSEITTPGGPSPSQFALSLDGRKLAFIAGTTPQLWVRSLDQMAAQPLAGTEGASYPFWSPDGRTIGFFADSKLKRIELTGGLPQVVADTLAGGGTWSNDGVIVFGGGQSKPLFRVPATGGSAVAITDPKGGNGDLGPQFLPDGRHILFHHLTVAGAPGQVSIVSVDGGEPVPVVQSVSAAMYAPPGYLLRVVQGALTAQRFDPVSAVVSGDPIPIAQGVVENLGGYRSAFSVSQAGILAHRSGVGGGVRQLQWTDRTGKTLETMGPPDEGAPTSFALSLDGMRMAIARTVQNNYDIWITDVARAVATRFSFDPASEYSPLWSPDGTHVVFRSTNRKNFGLSDLFIKPADGSADEKPFLVTPQAKTALDWSRDGRFLLYATQDANTRSDLWALPIASDATPVRDAKPIVIAGTTFDETQGQFSPDTRWVAYTSNESGRDEVYVRPFPESGGKWQVSTGGGSQPRWRNDGKELFYIAPDARLMAVPISAAPQARAVTVGAPVALFATRLASGPGISLTGYQSRALYAVTADGRFLMNTTVEADRQSPIILVQNWPQLLKK